MYEEKEAFVDKFLQVCAYILITLGTLALGSLMLLISAICIVETISLLK